MTTDKREKVYVCTIIGDDCRSKLFRYILGDKFTHIFFVYESHLWGGWWAADILNDGVVKLPIEKSSVSRASAIEFFSCKYPLERGLQKTRKFILSGYDFLALAVNLFRVMLYRWLGWKWLRPIQDTKKMFCSEYVATVFKLTNVPGSEELDPALTSTEMLRCFMIESEFFRQENNPLEQQRGVN